MLFCYFNMLLRTYRIINRQKCVLIFTEIQRLQKVSKYIIRNYFVLNITLWSVKTKRSINTPTRSRKMLTKNKNFFVPGTILFFLIIGHKKA